MFNYTSLIHLFTWWRADFVKPFVVIIMIMGRMAFLLRRWREAGSLSLCFPTGASFLHLCTVFSCDQAALWMVQSVCLPVTPFSLCSSHSIIMKFSGVTGITNDRSDVHAKDQGQKSTVKVTEVKTPFNLFRTITPVWIHIWWWNDSQSLMLLRRGVLLFLKVIRPISRSHGTKNRLFDPNGVFPDCNSSLNSPMALKW